MPQAHEFLSTPISFNKSPPFYFLYIQKGQYVSKTTVYKPLLTQVAGAGQVQIIIFQETTS